jgi:hypothetical protein
MEEIKDLENGTPLAWRYLEDNEVIDNLKIAN